jgi:hypothetical protein
LEGGAVETVTVECHRLDDLAERLGVVRLDVIKADVEGAEVEMFDGGAELIGRTRPAILFEVNDLQAGTVAPSMEWLWARGYVLYGVATTQDGSWSLEELHRGDDPSRFKEQLQIRPHLRDDPIPDLSPNLHARHPPTDRTPALLSRYGSRGLERFSGTDP